MVLRRVGEEMTLRYDVEVLTPFDIETDLFRESFATERENGNHDNERMPCVLDENWFSFVLLIGFWLLRLVDSVLLDLCEERSMVSFETGQEGEFVGVFVLSGLEIMLSSASSKALAGEYYISNLLSISAGRIPCLESALLNDLSLSIDKIENEPLLLARL